MTTDTDPLDEIEVPHLKARLWSELAQLHHEQRSSEPATPETVVGLARRRSRRSLRIGLGAAVAAAVVVGVVATQLAGTDTDRPTDTAPGTPLMERVAAATEEAIDTSVIHTVDRQTLAGETEPSTVELWTDETSGATRILRRDRQGNPAIDVGALRGPTVDSPDHSGQRSVDFCAQEYAEITDTGGASMDLPPGRPLREQIAAGELVEDGTETVDGRELIRLRRTLDEGDGSQVLLVDPDTFRPVRARGTLADSHGGASYEQTIEYLPRTAENLALIVPRIPEGFTPADLPLDEEDIERQRACLNG